MNIVCYGGGTNSTAMIIEMYHRNIPIDLILFADTGGEQPHTYEFIEIFNQWLLLHNLPKITMLYYYDKVGNRLTLEEECLRAFILPSIAYGYKQCSLKHKISVQDKFCNHHPQCKSLWSKKEKVTKFIGYDFGEYIRVQHAKEYDKNDHKYNRQYLLFDLRLRRQDCYQIIKKEGLPNPQKSSCFFCPSMKKREIENLWKNYPELFKRAVYMEHNAFPNLTIVKGLGRSWSWESYKNICNNEAEQILLDNFIEPIGGCLCGAPCGCYDG